MNGINPFSATLGILTTHIRSVNRSGATTKALLGFDQSDIGSAYHKRFSGT
jgi:hypothetical protein